ncbi:C-type lectin domain family 4 member G-like [Erpetoichthys calabaricus]|uniref:C-type lectin domain family 4 member G-like n=1 Tax=Erpetoichthys calabaricus TaxID=27687 RepID=UPI00223489AC|nr:C-type lectin domain family 4 member G-like [Erpetoichthys calabaricus]
MADKFRVSVKVPEDYCTIEELSHGSGDEGHTAPVPQIRAERRVNLVKMMKIFGVLLVAGLVSLSVYHFIKLNHNEQELEELRNAIATLNEVSKVFSDLKEYYCDATNTFPNKTCSLCKVGWIAFSSKCYFFSIEKMIWNGSRDRCKTSGARLVNIQSLEEQELLELPFLHYVYMHC